MITQDEIRAWLPERFREMELPPLAVNLDDANKILAHQWCLLRERSEALAKTTEKLLELANRDSR